MRCKWCDGELQKGKLHKHIGCIKYHYEIIMALKKYEEYPKNK